MKKEHVLAFLFFACLWGASEVVLGELLYQAQIPHRSIPLTVIGFMILAVAKNYLPGRGSATAIASIAMLFQLANARFFACHLLAILILGLSYDLCSGLFKKNQALLGFTATSAGYLMFALLITFVFRHPHWAQPGLEKFVRYLAISGPIAAVINLAAVPAGHHLGMLLESKTVNPFAFKSGLATGCVTVITAALWFLGIARII
jgi:hypothetical protein